MFGTTKAGKNVRVLVLTLLMLAVLGGCSLLMPEPTTPLDTPAPPTGVLVTPQRDRILIAWQDNSYNEIGFTVYRDTLGDGSEAFAKRADLPANTTRFSDTDIKPGVSYRYAVAANGEGSSTPKVAQTGDPVTPVPIPNDAPTADPQARSTPENKALTLKLSGTDPDGNELSFFIKTQPRHGNLSEVSGAGEVVYTPDADFAGEDSFTFYVSDGVLDSAPATVALTVLSTGVANTAPVAESVRIVAQQGEPETVQLSASDANGDALEYHIETAPTNGTLDLSRLAEGTVVYQSDASFAGEDSFRFKVNDGLDDSNVATVKIRVNRAPSVAKEITGKAVYRLDLFYLDVSRIFTDADGDTLEISAAGLPASVKLSKGLLQGRPDKNEVGSYNVTLTAQDGWESSASTSFTLEVTATCPFDSYKVTFADSNLRRKVNRALNLSAGSVPTCGDMASLKTLEAYGSTSNTNKITSLDGLEHAYNLTVLNLADNQIDDISALSAMTRLTNLTLSGNAISDLTPLARLTELTDLQLSRNTLTSVSALSNLTELITLNLADNSVRDISALSKLTELTTLTLLGNRVSDIGVLDKLTELTTLSLANNEISDLTALRQLIGLYDLKLEGNQISNLEPLEDLIYVRRLDLSSNKIVDTDALRLMVRLTHLELSNNKIQDIGKFDKLVKLTDLNLAKNEIKDMTPLSGLPELKTLLMSENRVVNTNYVKNLPELTELNLSSNHLNNIWGLNRLPKLKELDLGKNAINNIEPLIQNSGLGEGDTVKLGGNSKIPARQIERLEDKKVEVKLGE